MRRSRPIGLLLAVALALTGCSVARGFGVGTQSVPGDALCPSKPRAKHITVVDWWETSSSPAMLSSAKEFNCAHPNIAINISIQTNAGDDSNGKVLAAVAAGKPPDLLLSWDDPLASWAQKGEIQDIGDLAAANGVTKAGIIPQAWNSCLYKGKLYGMPVDWDPDTLLWYNKKVFKDAGLDPTKPPTTWSQLQSYARKIDQVRGGKIKRLGFIPWSGWQFSYIQIGHMYGADFQNGSQASVRINSPGLRKTFDYYTEIAKRYGGGARINSFTTLSGAEGSAADPLLSGRLGMNMIGDWEIGQRSNVGAKVFNETLGVTSVPVPPGGHNYLSHSGWSFMVPVGAKHAKEAVQFAAWMQQPANFVKHIATANGWLPARTATRSQSFYTQSPAWQGVLAVEAKNQPDWWLAPSPILQQYYRITDETNASVTALEGSPGKQLTKAQSQVEAVLRNVTALGIYK
ncbi:MAG: extracellular solute-binding protein [Mycobacteriales bacterium]